MAALLSPCSGVAKDAVIWFRDASFTKQLFISPSYENIWNHTCQELLEKPQSWYEHLVDDVCQQTWGEMRAAACCGVVYSAKEHNLN